MFRTCLLAAALMGTALPASAADLITPVTHTTVVERHTILPEPAGTDNSISVEAHDNATVNIYQRGGHDGWPHLFGDWNIMPKPRIIPTFDEVRTRCHFDDVSTAKIVNNIERYSTTERFTIDYFWVDGPFTTAEDRLRYNIKACGVLASRLPNFS